MDRPRGWLAAPDLDAARHRLSGAIRRTPLLPCGWLAKGRQAPSWLKCESLQETGSFKVRGALNAVAALAEKEPGPRGVITVSAGNHAQAVAWAASRHGIPAVVVMPQGASRTKTEATRELGAKVVFAPTAAEAFRRAEALGHQEGLAFLHPFDAVEVIAGHGSVALEIAEEVPGPAVVVVPVGGGGLIAGIAAALRRAGRLSGPDRMRIYGVEPEGAAAMRLSLDAGRPVATERLATIADGLAAPMAGDLAFGYVANFVEEIVVVTDEAILAAMHLLLTRSRLVVEPAGAAAVAALMQGAIPVGGGQDAVAIVSGGNADPELLAAALRRGRGCQSPVDTISPEETTQ